MIRTMTYKFALKPNQEQRKRLSQFAGISRVIYNKSLELYQNNIKEFNEKYGEDSPSVIKNEEGKVIARRWLKEFDLNYKITTWRNDPETPWLADAPVIIQQQAAKNLVGAWKKFFDAKKKGIPNVGIPRFHRWGNNEGFRVSNGEFSVDTKNSKVRIPKIGWIRFVQHRKVPDLFITKSITVSKRGVGWFVTMSAMIDVPDLNIILNENEIGIDLGIKNFVTTSDGQIFSPIHSFKSNQYKLKKIQQRLLRATKGSNRRRKILYRLRKLYNKITDLRSDHLHKISKTLVTNYSTIVMEDLKVKNMSKSASGTKESPGKNVAAKRGLNKSILDQGWGEFRRQMEYKSEWYGNKLIFVAPQNTSRTCPLCSCVSEGNRKTQEKFACIQCGYTENADLVAARNILNKKDMVISSGEVVDKVPDPLEK